MKLIILIIINTLNILEKIMTSSSCSESKPKELVGYCNIPVNILNYQIAEKIIEQKITDKSKIQDILISAAQQEQRLHEY